VERKKRYYFGNGTERGVRKNEVSGITQSVHVKNVVSLTKISTLEEDWVLWGGSWN
jgi:hypothetical protein